MTEQTVRDVNIVEVPTIASPAQSLAIVQEIVSTGLDTICWLRDIFPGENFARVVGKYESTMAMRLNPVQDDAKQFQIVLPASSWVFFIFQVV